MELLITLSLVYALVFPVALVASLLVIWLSLRRVAKVLAQVEAALATAANETAPLERYLHRLHAGTRSAHEVGG